MSFEGHYEFLCGSGHLWGQDAADPRDPACPWCGEPPAVHYLQDHTNGEPTRLLFERVGQESCRCGTCGGTGKVEVPRYRVPGPDEKVQAQHWDGEGWQTARPFAARPYRPTGE